MMIPDEKAMIAFGRNLAQKLTLPATIELIGDLGAGKTTLVKGLAEALEVVESVTSPSFTIVNNYSGRFNGQPATINHYDFYRLDQPGILSDEISESICQPQTLTVVEWGDSVDAMLPQNRIKVIIRHAKGGGREVELIS